jgi:hypothetical protein
MTMTTKTMTERPAAPAKGQRKIQERFEGEAAVRRTLFVGSLAAFVALFGVIAWAGKPISPVTAVTAVPPAAPAAGDRILAEVPIADLTGANGGGSSTIVRIVAPESRALVPHARSRATP